MRLKKTQYAEMVKVYRSGIVENTNYTTRKWYRSVYDLNIG